MNVDPDDPAVDEREAEHDTQPYVVRPDAGEGSPQGSSADRFMKSRKVASTPYGMPSSQQRS